MAADEDTRIQPCGFLLELSPDWLILRASENIHRFLDRYHAPLIGEPLTKFTLAQPLHDLRNSLSRQRSISGVARVYHVRLIDDPRYFDIAFQLIDGRILLEGVPSSGDSFGSALGAVSRLIDGLDGNDLSALLNGAARRMRALTGFDRVTVTVANGSKRSTAESSRNSYSSPDLPGNLPWIVEDSRADGIPLFPRDEGSSAANQALLRCPDTAQLQALRSHAIASVLNVPLIQDGEVIGRFHCENRSMRQPHFELQAAAELFAQIVAMKLPKPSRASRRTSLSRG